MKTLVKCGEAVGRNYVVIQRIGISRWAGGVANHSSGVGGFLSFSRNRPPRFLVGAMGALDLPLRRRRSAGAAPRRRQAHTDRGRPRLLRQGARRGLTQE